MSNDPAADQELLAAHRRRLRVLELQAAQFGMHVPPHITTELDDLKVKISALEQQNGARPTFRTWVVDPLHRGDYLTIGEAIAAASAGDRILVRSGIYHEALVLDKQLELIGEGEPGDVLVQASEANVIHFNCIRGRVKNLTLRQRKGEAWVVLITSGRLDLEDCDISGVGNGAVLITGNAHPWLRRNRIHANQGNGLRIAENGQGLLEENEIFGNAYPAVYIDNGANPTLRRNRIHANQSTGVSIYDNGQGLLEANEIFGHHAKPTVVITTGASPTLRKNRIHANQGNGVYIYDSGQGLLEENEIFGHALPAVAIDSGANPTLRRNRIHDNQSYGVFIKDNGQALIEENEIFGHAIEAVVIKTGANPTLRKNRIHDNQRNGVSIGSNGRGLFEDNDIYNHNQSNFFDKWHGVLIENGARPTFRRNKIRNNKSNGIRVVNGGGGVFENNVLSNNRGGNWHIATDCLPNVTRSANSD